MLILGLETSCDETAAALVRDGRDVLSNIIASQHELHEEYGGVVPEIASRAHLERLLPIIRAALAEANVTLRDVSAIAVGHRPGLIGSLLVGVSAAKALAWSLGVPLIGVDHVHAHLYAGFLLRANNTSKNPEPETRNPKPNSLFPALGLVVSGGHTLLYRCDSPVTLTRLGGTIDDAVGEAYDKAATILGLAHPGGPKVDALARLGDDRAFDFPRSLIAPGSLDFSFSGLKTAVLYRVRGYPGQSPAPQALTDSSRADLAAGFQRAAIGVLITKLERALDRLSEEGVMIRSLIIGGGVSANSRLRSDAADLARRCNLRLILPALEFCTDNAAMIAGLGAERLRIGAVDDLTLRAEPTTVG